MLYVCMHSIMIIYYMPHIIIILLLILGFKKGLFTTALVFSACWKTSIAEDILMFNSDDSVLRVFVIRPHQHNVMLCLGSAHFIHEGSIELGWTPEVSLDKPALTQNSAGFHFQISTSVSDPSLETTLFICTAWETLDEDPFFTLT